MSAQQPPAKAEPKAAINVSDGSSPQMRSWAIAGGIGLALAIGAMLAWCWQKSPDALVDFGREVYVPWRLAEGQALYRDIAYFNGPLSPYWNAMWFRVFGPSISCLAIVNTLIFAAIVGMSWQILRVIGNRAAAWTGSAVLVLSFGFGQYFVNGNYNYIYPYSHEATHGTALSLAAIFCYWHLLSRDRLVYAALTGAACGLTFLTKPEIFLALAVAMAVGIPAACAAQSRARAMRLVGSFFAGLLIVPAVAWLWLRFSLDAETALSGCLGAFRFTFDRNVTSLSFYQDLMGLTQAAESLAAIGKSLAGYLIVLGSIFTVSIYWPVSTRWRSTVAGATLIATAILGATVYMSLFFIALLPLPLILAVVVAWNGRDLKRGWQDVAVRPRQLLRLVFSVFALVLLAKIVLRVQVVHYGFVLAMPGALVLTALWMAWVPAAIDRRGGQGMLIQGAWLGLTAAFVGTCLYGDHLAFAAKTVRVSQGGDAIMALPGFGDAVNAALAEINAVVEPGQSIVVLPEGVMINYLARRVNPTPYLSFLPPELQMFGEGAMLAALEAHPPDFIVWAPRDLSEYGYTDFGQGYAERLANWKDAHYAPLSPTRDDGVYRLHLLKRVVVAP